MRVADQTTALRTLIAAIPDDRLRELVLTLLLNGLTADAPAVEPASAPAPEPEPRKRRGGWPRGRRRGARKATKAAKATARRRAARRKARARSSPEANGGNGAETTVAETAPARRPRGRATAAATTLWRHAEKLEPKAPWRALVREFGLNEAVAQDACRAHTLPPGVSRDAAARFCELQPTGV